jgi:hypothetical protein
MKTKTTTTPTESTADTDPVERLIAVLAAEGFVTSQDDEEWKTFGERIYQRDEKISLFRGETMFILTEVAEVNEKILMQAVESVSHTYEAKGPLHKAMSVMQSTTVYLCLISRSDSPYGDLLSQHIKRLGGATVIPVIFVPGINQVIYPTLEEKIGSVRPRIEYLQYLLGERRTNVNMHRATIQAFYVSAALLLVLLAAVVFSIVTGPH